MSGIMNGEEMLADAISKISGLTLTGPINWSLANAAINQISAVKDRLKKDRETREAAYAQSVADAKAEREKRAQEAAQRGEELVGGETYVFGADGKIKGGENK